MNDQPRAKKTTWFGRLWGLIVGVGKLVVSLLLFYAVIALVGLIPVNNQFEPTPDGVEVTLISTAIHADIIVPMSSGEIDWRETFPAGSFAEDTSQATHLAIGWGDQGFYIQTPTWNDLTVSTAANALFWPSDSCVHVAALRAPTYPDDARSVRLSTEQYEHLAAFIRSSLQRSTEGDCVRLDGAYGSNDAFFAGTGSYHCFNTCNCWTGRALQASGVRTGWFTPFPRSMFLYLEEE